MKKLYSVIIFMLVASSAISQVSNDTLFLKNKKKIIGSIIQLHGSNIVKIKTSNGTITQYSNSAISKVKFGYNPELEVKLLLTNGKTLWGMIYERKNNSFLAIKTSDNKIIRFFDYEIRGVEKKEKNLSEYKMIYLKDGSVFWGTIEKTPKLSLLRNVWINQLLRIENKDILRVDSIFDKNNSTHKELTLNDGTKIDGFLNNYSTGFVLLKTEKYGDYIFKNNNIIHTDDFVTAKHQSVQTTKKDTTVNKSLSTSVKAKKKVYRIINDIRLYELNASLSFGVVSSKNFYYWPQIGVDALFFKFKEFNLSTELRAGLPTDFGIFNCSIGLSPFIASYRFTPNISAEIAPDIHLRFYDGGMITKIGALAGARYKVNQQYSAKLRVGYSGGLYVGISGMYSLKNY